MKKYILIIILTLCIFQLVVLAAAITIGMPTTDRSSVHNNRTVVNEGGVADGTGKITKIYIWANADMTNVKVATFSAVGNVLTTRDWEAIPGTVTAGAEREFTVDLDVQAGDYIGISFLGLVELDYSGGAGAWYTAGGDYQVPCTDYTFSFNSVMEMSLRGVGATAEEEVNAILFGFDF